MTEKFYHFIGIGGIGMSALARILLQKGEKVQGSDVSSGGVLEELSREGAKIYQGHDESHVSEQGQIVYSTDIVEKNPEYQKALQSHCSILHRSQMLDSLMQGYFPLLVTGTHGKTTTSALLSTVLVEAGEDPCFVVGGIVQQYQTNGRYGKGKYFVAEADESDGSFLRTSGFGGIVTNLEKEHLNYWKTEQRLREGFAQFFDKITSKEHLFWCMDDKGLSSLNPPGISYGFSSEAQLRGSALRSEEGKMVFDLCFEGKHYSDICLPMMGAHNVLNAMAVFGMALKLNISEEKIREAFLKFSGTKRRQEFLGKVQEISLYDDYGHHPTEIFQTIKALRNRVEEKKIIVVFQPHRFTRTRDLLEEFGSCFREADEVIVTDIYAASEAPIEGIDAKKIVEKIKEKNFFPVTYIPKEKLISEVALRLNPHDVLLTQGAGDITKFGPFILEKCKEKKLTVGVLFGGRSSEHEVSKVSAKYITSCLDPSLYEVNLFALTKEGYWTQGKELVEKVPSEESEGLLGNECLEKLLKCDLCFPVFHGPYGEDGMIQGFLETLDLDYVGCDYAASALCMNKGWLKHLVRDHQIDVADFLEILKFDWEQEKESFLQRVEQKLSFPLYVKPSHLGSSIGIRKVLRKEGLEKALDFAFEFDTEVLVEQEVRGQEVEFSVLGSDFIHVAEPGEILTFGGFYDYDKKYGESPMQTKIPANLSLEVMKEGKNLAKKIYKLAGCKGMARVDFFYTGKKFVLNEINPIPGFTQISLYPKMWEASGVDGKKLIDRLIISSLYRRRKVKKLRQQP